ncbi:MAG: hypothetical protein ACOC4E_02200 [Patescibacteria group bacterium]
MKNIQFYGNIILRYFSYYFFFLIIVAIVVSNIYTIPVFVTLDWSNIQTLIEFLRVALFWVIAVEFARLLIEYKTEIVIELLVFVLARKILLIEDNVPMVALGVLMIILLMLVRHLLVKRQSLWPSQEPFHTHDT